MLKTPIEIIEAAKGRTNCINAEEAIAMISKLDNALLIDVREKAEVAQASLKGAVSIPRGVLEMKICEFCTDGNATIFLHCATGGRATLSAAALQDMGYKNIYVIADHFDKIKQCLEKKS